MGMARNAGVAPAGSCNGVIYPVNLTLGRAGVGRKRKRLVGTVLYVASACRLKLNPDDIVTPGATMIGACLKSFSFAPHARLVSATQGGGACRALGQASQGRDAVHRQHLWSSFCMAIVIDGDVSMPSNANFGGGNS